VEAFSGDPAPAAQRSPAAGEPSVTDNPAASRYELRIDGELAGFSDYHLRDGVLSITHTEVAPAFQGAHLATHLAQFSLDDARRRGLAVLPYCPYTSAWIKQHPQYSDLVPPDRRAGFGLE
jgi:predicted GNAT family acetyltransferase